MPLHARDRPRAPALVGGRELRRTAECKGRHDLDRERGGVVVVDHDGDVRLGLGHPLLGFFETGEHPFPVGLLGLLVVDRGADRRHVRRRNSCNDPSHVWTSPCWMTWPWISTWRMPWTWPPVSRPSPWRTSSSRLSPASASRRPRR